MNLICIMTAQGNGIGIHYFGTKSSFSGLYNNFRAMRNSLSGIVFFLQRSLLSCVPERFSRYVFPSFIAVDNGFGNGLPIAWCVFVVSHQGEVTRRFLCVSICKSCAR